MPDKSTRTEKKSATVRRKKLPWLSFVLLVAAVGVGAMYWQQTRLPKRLSIAGGPVGGRYAQIAEALAKELRLQLNIDVSVRTTQGSLENLQLIETRQVDLGLYQSGTRDILNRIDSERPTNPEAVSFVSNLYSEYLIPFGSTRQEPPELSPKFDHRWSCNDLLSGDYAVLSLLLQHLNMKPDDTAISFCSYADIPSSLAEDKFDAGVVCSGLDSPALLDIATSADVRILQIPAAKAFAQKHSMLVEAEIPAGLFSTTPMVPAEDFPTVAVQAQLLSGQETPVRLVEAVTSILADAEFQRRNRLLELFDGGASYATARPEFTLHSGAEHIFYPELKPLLNPDFVEGTEGLRSFIVSLLAAAWLVHRWWKRREMLSQEHRLDRYIRDLLQLERDQMDVDGDGGPQQAQTLQKMLDAVTLLRQEALAEFTAHELNEDSAVDCFIQMCHALSDKINAKLMRHTILNANRIQLNQPQN